MGTSAHTGAMIALVPTEADLDRLAIDEDLAEPRDDLHLTLYFLGEAAAFDAETREGLVNAVTSMIENRSIPPVHARAFGYAHWNPASEDPAWVLNVGDAARDEFEPDGQSLGEVRGSIEESWFDGNVAFELPTQHSPWQPHICLAYAADDWSGELASRLGDVTFDRVRIAFGGENTDVPLGRTATVASSRGGIIVPWHVVQNHSECSDGKPWAVVKDADGSVAGCHASRSDADQQVAALYANEPDGTTNSASTDCAPCAEGHTTTTSEVTVTNATGGADATFTFNDTTLTFDGDGTVHAAKVPTDGPDVSGDDGTGKKAPPFKPKGAEAGAESFADGGCPEGQRKLPSGDCISEDEYAAMAAWHGVLCVEGITTGDGREFAPDALTWAENALLRWQKESAHGGEHDVTVSVGRIDEVYRDGEKVMGSGVLDLQSPDGWEIYRRMRDGFAGGISIDADDISDADVEFVWSDEPDGADDDDPLKLLFGQPEKMVFHAGRVRAATLVDIPAFVEARIQLGAPDGELVTASATSRPATVVATHQTPTSDDAWDSDVTARRLPNIMPIERARAAYAYVETGDGDATRAAKIACGYLHHEVDEAGDVGAANLTACSAAIATLRLDDSLGDDERKMIYVHLAAHLRDADREAPPLEHRDAVTAAVALDDWRPARAWFEDPQLSVPTGITVTDEGRVYGHAAQWGECHIGFQDECVTLPREDAHPYFMTGEVVCADGSRVAVGQLTVGTGHAPMSYRASHAAEHYDNTGTAVADVAVGNDRFGVWVAGAVRANVAASRVHELRASGRVSGDWRRIGGQLRLVGLLAVNVPGFPIQAPRARIAAGAPQALVAAGRTTVGSGPETAPSEDQLNQLAMRRVMGMLMRRVRPTEEVSS